jgi:hypothetical protein
MDVVFNGVEYIPGDEEQSLLLTHGLIKAEGKNVRVSFNSPPGFTSLYRRSQTNCIIKAEQDIRQFTNISRFSLEKRSVRAEHS